MIAGEAFPFAKAGGLGDVIGSLSAELDRLGLAVSLVIPRHRVIDLNKFDFKLHPASGVIRVGSSDFPWDVHWTLLPGSSVKVFLIGNDHFFDRPGIYFDAETGKDYPDQSGRWIFFQRATMEFISSAFPSADILHCHDHQAALIPAYLSRLYRREGVFQNTASVFTIHNMGYQGLFGSEVMLQTGFDPGEFYATGPFEFFGMVNFMKAGIATASAVTTVSETYAREIQSSAEFGYGLEDVLRIRRHDLVGILNGIDTDRWNPAADPLIAAPFSMQDLAGKQENKKALLKEFGLDARRLARPVLAMISRIDVQKGFDLLVTILDRLLEQDLYFVLLGTGHKETEAHLRHIVDRHPEKASALFAFDDRLAHLTEAGADMFLMPSKYEPCGLNQMYSLRYGTVPIVRSTGGLRDTVQEFNPSTGEGTGFCFSAYDANQFSDAIQRALALWKRREDWRRLMVNGMTCDFSWRVSAGKYVQVYEKFMGHP